MTGTNGYLPPPNMYKTGPSKITFAFSPFYTVIQSLSNQMELKSG
jgi:hypothetical protein